MCAEVVPRISRTSERGLSLVELVVFIVIVSTALAGVLLVLNVTTSRSADPLIRKQMLALAEAVLEEVRLQPWTWCDPDDPNAATATSAADCTGGAGGANDQAATAPTPGEARGSLTAPFDNVRDYQGAAITTSLAGQAFPTGYAASVAVAPQALAGVAADAALGITVTVTFGAETLVLEGYRTRYAPNSLP